MHSRRNSTGVQLPLPTTLVHSTQTSPTTPSFPITASNIHLHNSQFPPSGLAHVAAYTAGGSMSSPVRSTHAGGIQPSASFFRPVRPNQPQSPTMWNPPRYPDTEDDDQRKTAMLSPPPLTTSLSHSSSLSAHQHHHSNHSSEHVKAHEDQGGTTTTHTNEANPKGVVSKLSREPLIPFRAHKDPQTTSTSKRVSTDGPGVVILPPPSNTVSAAAAKRHSASYRHRLTFDSIRRSLDSATGSTNAAMKRFSFGKPTGVVLESEEGHIEERRRSRGEPADNDIPLTPRKKTDGPYRAASTSSLRSAASSRRRRSASLSSSHTEPTSFDPTAPPLGPREHPLMKTPLTHPLDPSLLPERRLMKLHNRDPYGIDNSRTKAVNEGSEVGLPPPASEKKPIAKGFVTFLYPSSMDSPRPDAVPKTRRQPKEGSLVRRYYLHPSRNGFYFGGRVMTGGDEPYAFIFTLVIVCGLAALWFAFVGKWWWQEAGLEVVDGGTEVVNEAARSAGKAVVILDPGILPRGLDPNPPYPATSPSNGDPRAPLPRDLKVRNDVATTASMHATTTVNG
ncbi:zinc ion binding protein [Coprinopsis sp. MPI-PUGE-AT-0042]|nr:zinc ion binding protein [Coprinopsis sp. MPI-PUGE-AT-0042]